MTPQTEQVEKADKAWKSKKDPVVWRKAVKKYESDPKNKEKLRSKEVIRGMVRRGELKRPKSCPICGKTGVRIIFHHYKGHTGDSQKKVKAACDECHARIDSARSGKAIGAAVKRTLAAKKKSGK